MTPLGLSDHCDAHGWHRTDCGACLGAFLRQRAAERAGVWNCCSPEVRHLPGDDYSDDIGTHYFGPSQKAEESA